MNVDFKEIMSAQSSGDLLDLIGRRKEYAPGAINAALGELLNRGHEFTAEELSAIRADIEEKERGKNDGNHIYSEDSLIFPVNTQPVYYSRSAIIGFSALVTPLFGTVLMAINLKGNIQRILTVVAFGVLYEVAVAYLLSLIEDPGTVLPVVFNVLGALVLGNLFWARYIGNDTKYVARSLWIPLIIAFVIVVAMVYGAFFAMDQAYVR